MRGESKYGPVTASRKRSRSRRRVRAPRTTSRSAGYRNIRTGGFLGIEKKYLDTFLHAHVINSPGNSVNIETDPFGLGCLNSTTIGSGPTNREGRKCKSVSLHLRGHVDRNGAIHETDIEFARTVTIWIVRDVQTNGTQLNSEDVLVNPSGFQILAPFPFNQLENSSRFTILAKQTMVIESPTTFGDTQVPAEVAGDQIGFDSTHGENGIMQNFEFNIKLDDVVNYSQSNDPPTVSDINDVSYHVICACSHAGLRISYNSRYRFLG